MTNPFPLPQKIHDALEQVLDYPLLPTEDEYLANPEDRLLRVSHALQVLWVWETSVELDTLAIQAQPPMSNPISLPQEIRDALDELLTYALPLEYEHFANNPELRDGHIYHSLHALRRWLETEANGSAELE
jgi:hypothetical protein